jgi:hypothetical protein
VWSEKGTIRGTLSPVLREYGVTFRVMHGYGSSTAVHQAATDSMVGDKLLIVYYVGDWDPSGLHMSQVDLPLRIKEYGGVISFQRLALTTKDTMSGIPSFPVETKKQDPRYRWYRERHGSLCWELDALSPNILRERVAHAILNRINVEAWERAELAGRPRESRSPRS